mmetsp:Transcript_3752/g.3544  ORF Transcript_3752/g.3544 Transcript_3752/m.3544 type:complete len:145 (-) Transcript_3752:134-568(-)
MVNESTPLTGSSASTTSIGSTNMLFCILAIIGGVGLLGESGLAMVNHTKRGQMRRLVIDVYCFLSAIMILNMEIPALPFSGRVRKFLATDMKYLTSPVGLSLFYIVAGSLECTRDPTVAGGDLANILGFYMFALAGLSLIASFF